MQLLQLLIIVITIITFFFPSDYRYLNRIAIILLLYSGVLAYNTLYTGLVGSGVGVFGGLFPVTTFFIEGNEFTSTTLFDLFVNTVLCEDTENLPKVIEFNNLHLTENFIEVVNTLNDLAGVYCIKNLITGSMYIGSSMLLADRFKNHFIKSSNAHLRSAIKKYGLANFKFSIVEFVEPHPDLPIEENRDNLLAREQHWLDWLFSLPSNLRYNFNPTAGTTLGYKHSEESRAKMSVSMKGKNLGKEPVNKGVPFTEAERQVLKMAQKHRYKPVYFYDGINNLITFYESLNATCRAEHANKNHMIECIKTGRPFRGYFVTYTPINK
jgi:hypothetical protein